MTRAKTWFASDAAFRQLCGDAVSQAKGERAEEFAQFMMQQANKYGLETNLSQRQLDWLCEIADHVVPLPL